MEQLTLPPLTEIDLLGNGLADGGGLMDGGVRVATTDREHDCVPEISAAGLPSALANSVTFTLTPYAAAQ